MKSNYQYDIDEHGEIEEEELIVCPYCGCEHELNYDYFESDNEYENDNYECCECEQNFIVKAEVRYEYWAVTKKKEVE